MATDTQTDTHTHKTTYRNPYSACMLGVNNPSIVALPSVHNYTFYRSKEGLFMESTEGKRVDLIAHRPEWWPPLD